MGVSTVYLIAYNAICACVWGYVFYLTAVNFLEDKPAVTLWEAVKDPLTIIQTAAVMEILHSLFGLVRSPVITNIIQVGSRLAVLWCYVIPSPASQAHWSLYMLIGSWSFVEVPRYAFYMAALVTSSDKIPGPLFFLRYSLFMVLYPTGISGEIFSLWNSLPRLAIEFPFGYRFSLVILALYAVGGPYMIMNMFGQRKRAYRNRANAGKPARKPAGLVWPVTNPKTQDRASTKTNKEIFAASIRKVDPELSAKIQKERNWRFGYNRHLSNLVGRGLSSKEDAVAIAKDGLSSAHNIFEFIRDEKTTSLAEAMNNPKKNHYRTAYIKGELEKPKNPQVKVPYGGSKRQSSGAPRPYYTYRDDETVLSGKPLLDQLDVWVKYGTIEESAAEAIRQCVKNSNEWLDLSDHTFILLGATSAMGPLLFLLSHGANIIALDINFPHVWKRLIGLAKNSCGSLTFPYHSDKEIDPNSEEMFNHAGANLLTDTPEIAGWLTSLKYDTPVTIGNYTYLDGALHVQLSVACDCIIEKVCQYHKQTSVAFLCTPTDLHVIPKEAHDAMGTNYKKIPFWQSLFRMLSFGKCLKKNQMKPIKAKNNKDEFYLVDGIVTAQGPNYALAKRLQHWRVVVAREAGHTTSSNVAPSTATKSVVHNAQFAAAYGGFHLFSPLEVMYQETSNAVMGILLIHDVRNKKGASFANYPMANPYELFAHGAFHGGVSRCAWKVDSIGEGAVISYYLGQYSFVMAASLAAVASVTHWVITGQVTWW